VSARDQKAVSKALVSLSFAAAITGSGDTKTSLRTHQGIGVDVRVVTPEQYPYALHHFTGSKEHNTKMRQIAKAKGFKMNEYGLFREETGENVPCRDEAELFAALGMAYIPPELREDRGEIEAARTGGLPELVEQDDLKGLLHVHTEYSDGHNTVMQLAEAAASLGYGYLGIADHSRSAYYAGGLSEEAVVRQQREIDALNEKGAPVQLFKGIESDILADGSLDYPEELLKTFDFVIASVHSGFRMDKQAMTKRIISALKNPYTTILGHPTGRRLLSREGYDVDVEAVLKAAAETGAVLEINANPTRLDLDWRWLQRAKELGIRFAICPDAHEIQELYDISYGVAMARKGWLEKADISNSLPAADLKALFSTRRGG
jgi:DNA polymerase (family 10)